MDLIIALLFASLEGREWAANKEPADTSFASVLGLGAFRGRYTRSCTPTLISLLIYALPLLASGMAALSTGNLFIMLVGGAALVMGLGAAVRVAARWPGRTPRSAALFECGIAWEEQGQARTLDWRQIASTRLDRWRYHVYTQDGREVVFDKGLRNQPFGGSLEAALAGEPDPNRPVSLMKCPHCGETIAADSSRCLFCMGKIG